MAGGYDRTFVIVHATGCYLYVCCYWRLFKCVDGYLCRFAFIFGPVWRCIFPFPRRRRLDVCISFYFAAVYISASLPFTHQKSYCFSFFFIYADRNFISATLFYIDFLFLVICSYWCLFIGYLLFFRLFVSVGGN